MRTKITIELSQPSLKKAQELIQDFRDKYKQGVHDTIKIATEALYNKVIEHCIAEGIHDELDAIHWEYNESSNIGRVWTNDWVLIFNEMGTGVVGKEKPHPVLNWEYDINEHGNKGWWYPSNNPHAVMMKDGITRAWTKGLPSRHMFYSAYQDIKSELGIYIYTSMQKTVGNMYTKE